MKTLKLVPLYLLLLFLTACAGASSTVSPTPTPPTNIPIKVTATDLANLYEQNVVAADYRFTQKLVTVSGKVIGIVRFTGGIHVHLAAWQPGSYKYTYVTCEFQDEQFQGVLDLKKDEEASLTGTCQGQQDDRILLKDCYTSASFGPKQGDLPPIQQPTPLMRADPPGASAICRDGTYSFSQNRRGTCSHHGGVAKWLP